MFIQTEETPNPESLKFLPGRVVIENGTYNFTHNEKACESILAESLLAVEGVAQVFFGYDFITVTKQTDFQWSTLKPYILTRIMDHFISGQPVLSEKTSQTQVFDDADPVVNQIRELIETRVRPAVAMDGGDIIFNRFEDGIVFLEMRGSCSGCPSSTATLKSGIENMLKHYVPEVNEVRAI
ncbi:MAG: NifU family protein [Alphaproteobacteria bacterium]|nr:NifU family protein [Alphaproteobacteria bacterium]OJV47678.1 MAG: NifU family protein [Alphaproteobacteria bacterium 43-37]